MTQFKTYLLAGVTSVSLAAAPAVPVHAADVLGATTGTVSGVTSGVTGDDASVDARMEAAGAASGITGSAKGALRSDTDAGTETDVETRGNVVNDMSAQTGTQIAPLESQIPDLDPALKLVDQGYSNIEPLDGAARAEGQTSFSAINPAGAEVTVVVDTRTGAVLSEQSAQ
jgi:hypothetical protein